MELTEPGKEDSFDTTGPGQETGDTVAGSTEEGDARRQADDNPQTASVRGACKCTNT